MNGKREHQHRDDDSEEIGSLNHDSSFVGLMWEAHCTLISGQAEDLYIFLDYRSQEGGKRCYTDLSLLKPQRAPPLNSQLTDLSQNFQLPDESS
jgi:hypothetical protein